MPELEETTVSGRFAPLDQDQDVLPLPSESEPLLPERDPASAHANEASLTTVPNADSITALRHVIFSSFIFVMAITMSAPVRPKIVLDAMNGDATHAAYYTGFVDSLQAIIAILFIPLLGAASDITGRRPILLMCHFGEVIALLIIAQFQKSLIIQFPAYLLITMTSAYFVISSTMIADLATGDTLQATTYFGYSGATHGIAFLVGPSIGAIMERSFYVASSLHLAAAVICASFLYAYFFVPETLASSPSLTVSNSISENESPSRVTLMTAFRETADRISHAVSVTDVNPVPRVRSFFGVTPAMRWLAVTIATASLAQSGLLSFIFLYMQKELGWVAEDIGYFMSGLGICMIISQAVLAPLTVKQLGERWAIIFALALHAVHFSMFGLAKNSTDIYIALIVGTFAFVYDPAVKAVLSKQTTPEKQGSLQGSLSALKDMVKPFGPILSTSLFGFGNGVGAPALPFFFSACIFVVSAGLAAIAFKKPGLKL